MYSFIFVHCSFIFTVISIFMNVILIFNPISIFIFYFFSDLISDKKNSSSSSSVQEDSILTGRTFSDASDVSSVEGKYVRASSLNYSYLFIFWDHANTINRQLFNVHFFLFLLSHSFCTFFCSFMSNIFLWFFIHFSFCLFIQVVVKICRKNLKKM